MHLAHDRLVGRDEGRLHLHRLEHEQRLPRLDLVARLHLDPDHGAGHRRGRASSVRRRELRGRGSPGRRRAAREGQARRGSPASCPATARPVHAPAAAGERRVLDEEGGRRPARAERAGARTSQRRNGRFVVTPSTSVSASAAASVSSASSRVSPCATSFAIIGSYARRDLVALLDARVDADPVRKPKAVEPPGLGQERAGVFGVEPHLDRVAK